MDQTTPTEKKTISTSTPTLTREITLSQSKLFDERMNIPLSTLAEVYPNHFILRYVIVPTAPHLWRALVVITGLLVVHYQVCSVNWSNEHVCLLRTNYILFAIECGLLALMMYTCILKVKIVHKQFDEDRERERERTLLEK